MHLQVNPQTSKITKSLSILGIIQVSPVIFAVVLALRRTVYLFHMVRPYYYLRTVQSTLVM